MVPHVVLASLSVAAGVPVGHPASLRTRLVADGYTPVPLREVGGGSMFVVPCRVGDRKLNLVLDTGAGLFAALTPAAAGRLKLVTPASARVLDGAGPRTAGATHLADLWVGDFRTDGGLTAVGGLTQLTSPAANFQLGVEVDGLLGHTCLEQFDAVVDYPSRTLFLRRPSQLGLDRLAGEWVCTRLERDGAAAAADVSSRIRLRIDGDAAKFGPADVPADFRLIVNDARQPSQLKLWQPQPDGGRAGTTGIYRLAGDELTICLSVDATKPARPTGFHTAAGSNCQLLEFRRVKK